MYTIDDCDDKVQIAVSATSGGIWSKREGIIYAGNAVRTDEELKEIQEEEAERNNKTSVVE